jgi:phosphotriesterase-related protein
MHGPGRGQGIVMPERAHSGLRGSKESMKSRETLIRLKKFQVDEKRRKVAQIEAMIAEFDRIAAQLEREIADGFDGTGVHPGIIVEIGASQGWISPLEERVHRAAARAQVATGLPLATHTLYHSTGAAQMALFDEEGVDPARVCISHCDTFPSLDYCVSVARWGGYVSIDNVGHQAGDHELAVRRLVLDLVEAGHTERILLSQDVGQVHELRSRGGRGYTYLIETFLPALRDAGVPEETLTTITVENPRRWLTITRG